MAEDKQYEIKVQYSNDTDCVIISRGSEIRKSKNIIRYVAEIYPDRNIKRILSRSIGTKRWELNWDKTYDEWRRMGIRVEAINDPGYEDYTGYGNRSDGKINRFYLGVSTGWMPIYLEILNSNSSGGSGLMWDNRILNPLPNARNLHKRY